MNGGVPSKELNETLLNILDHLESDSNLLDNSNNIKYIISLLQAGADPNTKGQDGKTLSYYLDEKLFNILNELASNSNLLDDSNSIQHIMFLLQAGADPNTKGQDGKTPLDYLNEELRGILNELASNSNLLDDSNSIQHIMFLLQAGADPNTKGQDGKTLSDYSNEKLRDILNELASNSNLLDNSNNIKYIISLLQAGANPNVQNQAGKTLSDYSSEKLRDILNELAINSDLLDGSNSIQYIKFLLGTGANPNVQNQDEKTLSHYVAKRNNTGGIGFLLGKGANPNVQDQSGKIPLHYAAENNCLQAIKFLLQKGADPNVQDQSGKTPFEYVTEHNCRQALKDLGYDSDDSCKDEGNLATPDSSVNDCSNNSDNGTEVKSVKLSNCNSEDSSDYDDIDHYDTSCGTRHSHLRYDGNINVIRKKDSFSLAKIKLNKVEREKYDSVWQKIYEIHGDLDKTCDKDEDYYKKCEEEFDEVIRQALKQGVMFTFPYKNDESFVDLMISTLQKLFLSYDTTRIPEFAERTKMSHIISGGATLNEFTQKNHGDFVNIICKDEDILSKRDKNISRLNNLAYESIVNKNNKQTHEYDLKAEIDNGHFCIEYPQDSIIEPVKILNNEKAKELNLKAGILKIGESIVRVERVNGKRNYTDILKGSIEMSFTTEVGEISICLQKDGNKIKVEIDEENKAKFNKLKDKSSLGENCLLEGKSFLKAIEDKGFEKNGSVSTETTKDDPSTDLTQASSFAAINTRAKGK
ncbi:ankyrin repeat domain-containing protein [Wolbachia endosymbiont of Delia radicum]|uniref:ankyrin repeat domain-containing protein n=1 Tax=Wolbachia endosymbiont of Delia radicum TaxID=502352 RepID=UPI001F298C7B|nr:ankyrin repeat domain-containing protein [Wolbachia endosymbiont of Delia radicum]UJQ20681.1 ankyrin repeat domain-containing protein [Wolbachia endosymbiont of Delia radicum]